jgi:hypothetical protein
MMNLIDTHYGISGEELHRRNGARAINVMMSTLRDLGRDQQPITDRDFQIYNFIHTSLNGIDIGEISIAPAGAVVSVQQVKSNPELDKIERGLETALGMTNETIEETTYKLPTSNKKAA